MSTRKRFKPTEVMKKRAKELEQKLAEFDWTEHCRPGETRDQARVNHYQQLRLKYGDSWARVNGKGDGQATKHPSIEQVYCDILWKDVKNLASIPYHSLPAAFRSKEKKDTKAAYDKQKYAEGTICTICTNKSKAKETIRKIGEYIRCLLCYQISLEYIWFCFHHLSEYSMISPFAAVCLIENALHEGLGVLDLASMLHADHKTDDTDNHTPHNRKTKMYSKIFVRIHRYQEILLGGITFLDANGHLLKSFQCGDFGRNNPAMAALHRMRHQATVVHARSLPVDDIIEFTQPLYHNETGGWAFDLPGFLEAQLPHWKQRCFQKMPTMI